MHHGNVSPRDYHLDEHNYYQHQMMHLSDDDGGIDERFDGDDDSVDNEPDEI